MTIPRGLAGRYPATFAALAAAGLAAAASFAPHAAVSSLVWRAGGGVETSWRLFTTHFVHLGAAHLLANLVAAALIGWTCDRLHLAGRLPGATLASLVGVDLGLAFGPWTVDWYVGLSGLLHGLFAWLCLALALDPRGGKSTRGLAAALCLGGLVKVLLTLGETVGAPGWLGIPQATPAHLYGYLGGALWALSRRVK